MLSTNRFAWLAAILLAVAFGVITTLSRASTPKVATFEGSVPREGVTAHRFTIQHEGAVEVTLTDIRPAPTATVGLGLGTPTAAGNCALVEAMDSTQVNGRIAGTLRKGTYCVAVYDSGAVTAEPLDYTLSVTEE